VCWCVAREGEEEGVCSCTGEAAAVFVVGGSGTVQCEGAGCWCAAAGSLLSCLRLRK
jgi:hypothetical protein